MNEQFRRFAAHAAHLTGTPAAFLLALAIVVIWAATGPLFGFSDTWQLVINTGTTIVTFLMVFLIQNSQNRDAKAVHLKLDELIRGVRGARNELLDCEDLTEAEIAALEAEFKQLRAQVFPKKAHRRRESARHGEPAADTAAARGSAAAAAAPPASSSAPPSETAAFGQDSSDTSDAPDAPDVGAAEPDRRG